MILNNLYNFFFAKRCDLCGVFNENNNLCIDCFSNLRHLTIACKKCQEPLNYGSNDIDICQKCIDKQYDFFNEMIIPLVYNPFIKKYLIKMKNHNAYYLADVFCRFLYNKACKKITENSVIVPIPLYSTRLFNRGYNQSLLLAKSFSKIANISCVPDLFLRIRNTNSQANKTFTQRVENVKKAFVFNKKYKDFIKNKQIFIIDDVITTGSTMFECAKSLDSRNQGVFLLSIARSISGFITFT